jgi:hypothetical protein
VFASSGDMPTNDLKVNPNGQGYVQRIGAAERSDVLDWARSVLAPRVQRVFEEFAEKYQWGDYGRIQFSNRLAGDGSRGKGIGGAQDRTVQASDRAVQQEALISFAGAFNYEVETRFAGEYQGAIDAYSGAASSAGTNQGRGQAWQGRPVRESIAAAVGRVSVDGSQQGGELPGENQISASNRAVRDGGGRGDRAGSAPLPGTPVIQGATGSDPRIVAVAEQYARDNGIDLKRQAEYVQVDPKRAARIAAVYEAMVHAPQDPKVKEAYDNLIRQTTAQYRALEAAGYKFWFIDPTACAVPGTRPYWPRPAACCSDRAVCSRVMASGLGEKSSAPATIIECRGDLCSYVCSQEDSESRKSLSQKEYWTP